MQPLKTDFSIFRKFDFEKPPIAVKYLFYRPDGIEPLGKQLALCEMLREAHERPTPFYFSREEESCFGKAMLGMAGSGAPISDGGELGISFGIFEEPRANARLRRATPSIPPGDVNYVAFSPLEKLTFEPDILLLMVKPAQAEILLRAMTYSTGELYESRSTCIGGCAWLYAYPYLSGKVNFLVTGLAFGMKGRHVFPEGWLLISIPYQWLPTITRSLGNMDWVLPGYKLDKDEFREYEQSLIKEIHERARNP
jgi:uncharacterized protein (DUF169 family)